MKCLEDDSVFNHHFDKEKQYKKDESPRQAWDDCSIGNITGMFW